MPEQDIYLKIRVAGDSCRLAYTLTGLDEKTPLRAYSRSQHTILPASGHIEPGSSISIQSIRLRTQRREGEDVEIPRRPRVRHGNMEPLEYVFTAWPSNASRPATHFIRIVNAYDTRLSVFGKRGHSTTVTLDSTPTALSGALTPASIVSNGVTLYPSEEPGAAEHEAPAPEPVRAPVYAPPAPAAVYHDDSARSPFGRPMREAALADEPVVVVPHTPTYNSWTPLLLLAIILFIIFLYRRSRRT